MSMYRYIVWYEVDGEESYWVAKAAEFPGISGIGNTREAALTELDEILKAAIEHSLELNIPIPEPFSYDLMMTKPELTTGYRLKGQHRILYRTLPPHRLYPTQTHP